MEVIVKNEKRFFCDVCFNEIEDDYPSEFVVSIDYGGEDSCYGCVAGEGELRKELSKEDDWDTWDDIRDYLSQTNIIQCQDCRHYPDESKPNFISDFEDDFRKQRVEMVRKLAKEGKLPELSDDNAVREERLEHWKNVKKNILEEMKSDRSDFWLEDKAIELVQANEKIKEYSA